MRRPTPTLLTALALATLLTACGSGAPTPSPVPTASPGPPQTAAVLKLVLVHQLGKLWYCDPDFYPIARQDEIVSAREHWPEVVADAEAFAAILADRQLKPDTAFTDAQKLAVYQAWKMLRAIALEPAGNAGYRFDYLAEPPAGIGEGTRTTGTISASGEMTVAQQVMAPAPNCPICLARGSLIDVPGGRPLPVDRLRIGDTVWTLDAAGNRIPGSVLAVGSTPVPASHRVVMLVFADGRRVTASPGHPLADGRRLGELRPGDQVDGSTVVTAALVPYAGGATFDLVVSGPTGIYLVDGIALRSTMR